MTPTTASPSPVLLNPVAPAAKSAAVTSDSGAKPDAASSGFGLLLGTLQQLQQKLPTGESKNDAASQDSAKIGDDSGNALPLLGAILPLAALPQATADETAKADAADTTKSKDEKDHDANIAAANLMLPIVAMPAPAGTNVALTAQPGIIGDAIASPADNKAAVLMPTGANAMDSATTTAANAAASMLTDSANAADTAAGVKAGLIPKAGINSVDTAVGVNANMTATTTALAKEMQGVSKSQVESDFDALVKHFDASSSQSTLPAVAIGDSANAHQASRTYFDAANNTTSVSVPVGSSGWSDAVTDKVMWFSANKISSAEIHLNPPDLGPLQVRVSMQHDQTSVIFTSQHSAVRDALDQALPRLREMMGSQGMHLLDVSVGGQSAQQQQQQFTRNNSADRGASSGGFFGDDSAETAVGTVTTVNTARLLRSGVDAYA